MNTILKLNDAELYFNITDADFLEKYTKAEARLKEDYANLPDNITDGNVADTIKNQCERFRSMLDAVWGDGTGQNVFGDTYAMSECLKVMGQINDFASEQEQAFESEVQQFLKGNEACR